MNRSPLQRKSWLNARPKTAAERKAAFEAAKSKPGLARTGFKRAKPESTSSEEKPEQAQPKGLQRTAMKRKRRRPKPGDEPRYKAWIKTQPCVVCGRKGRGVDGHHLINGKGEARKGMGQTAPDKFLIPMCRREHDAFHDRVGFCKGWSDEARLEFQETEVVRLRTIWADLEELGVLQEPERRAV